jgi:glycosyltransferase involved in cell wall biosynthesis
VTGEARIPVLYLAPWVDFGGSDKGTIDWFRWIDRDRFAPSLITTQPSDNRRLREIYPFAEEVWVLPDYLAGAQFPQFVFDFVHTRRVQVLHIMNSRLGYELLPDLAALDHPPKVVVQLHVEESDRSGYVRYVTTRYGNLVDGFSVTSEHLAQAVQGYEVPRSRIHVIPTGVDARGEFCPEHVTPLDEAREPGAFHILFAGRLADQKDPLLMIEVARRVIARHDHVRFDIVGDGPLEADVRRQVRELGLERWVRLHPPSSELARWLRSSDLLLMTSVFEGVPYVVYESLAMAVPVVAPALPGNVELMADTGGVLIATREDPGAYAEAIDRMIEDADLRRRLADAGRERMLQSFSLRDMAGGHEVLYDALLESREPSPLQAWPASDFSSSLILADRPATGTPPVSIVTPCFNHGRYLDGFLDAIDAQNYPALERIIVDDGSTDPETVAVLSRIEREGRAQVIRQERNSGPSMARNRAIAAASGRYILPVDADNLLLPGAVHALVEQLQAAGERVGFIYPGFQYFGTRDYRFAPPAYNLFVLLHGNYADTCSLLDRTIFDAGLRYAEDIGLGHEDWDLVLALGARGVIGEPSRDPVMLYRKQGFTRSDLVEYLRLPFWEEIQHRHPELFGSEDDIGRWGAFRGPRLTIKADWNPALSVILADPVDFDSEPGIALLRGLAQQSCRDFELIAECPHVPPHAPCVVHRLPPGLCEGETDRLQEALNLSRGRYLMLSGAPNGLFSDPTTVERLLRGFVQNEAIDATALADAGTDAPYRFQLVDRLCPSIRADTIAWPRELHDKLAAEAVLQDGHTVADLADFFDSSLARVQWRHFPGSPSDRTHSGSLRPVAFEPAATGPGARQDERKLRLGHAAAIPAAPRNAVPRWGALPTWMPPETVCLVRHRQLHGERRIVTNERIPPPGFTIEFDLGAIQHFSPPGTQRLLYRDGRLMTAPRGTDREPGDEVLGYLEEAPLPLFVGVKRVSLPDGSETLVLASERDPLHDLAASGDFLGFIETFPVGPVRVPGPSVIMSASLVRYVDHSARRHRYAAVTSADELQGSGMLSAELGELLERDRPDRIALWIDDRGRLSTERCPPPQAAAPGLTPALRWAGAPAHWRDVGYLRARPQAIARRLWDVTTAVGTDLRPARPRHSSTGVPSDGRRVLGYLHRDPGHGRTELFVAAHPVLADQFVTHHPLEATDLGYERVCSMGFIGSRARLTGALGGRRGTIPWASRFGLSARER